MFKEMGTRNYADIVGSNKLLALSLENFSNREELIGSVRNAAVMQGYATTIRKSKRDCYVIIGCDKGGKYRGNGVPIDQRKKESESAVD